VLLAAGWLVVRWLVLPSGGAILWVTPFSDGTGPDVAPLEHYTNPSYYTTA